MLTRPTDFEQFSQATGEQLDVIVAVSDGTDTWYFSGRPMPAGLGTSPVYPMLTGQGHSKLRESADMYGKRFSVSDVTVTLSNRAYHPVSGGRPLRASDLVGGCNGGSLKIYQMAGSDIADIADCMLVFDGNVVTCPSYNRRKVTIRAVDKGKMMNITLPKLTVKDRWGNAPADSRTQPIPVVYGQWDRPDLYADDPSGTGMFRGVIVEDDQTPIYLLSDHELNAADDVHILLSDELVAIKYIGDAYNGTQGHWVVGRITICYLDFPLSSTLPGIYDWESHVADDPENAHDGDTGTFTHTKDNYADSGVNDATDGYGAWAIASDLAFRKYLLTGNPSVAVGYKNLETESGIDHDDIFDVYAYLFYYHNGGDQSVTLGRAVNYTNLTYGDTNAAYLPVDGSAIRLSDLGADLSDEFIFLWRVLTVDYPNGIGDGTVDNQQIMKVGELFLRLNFDIDDTEPHCWSSGAGKEYGSWIDDGARSNPHDAGDVIEDPASIVEDLFRSYLGLGDSDIDVGSFDDALNPSVKARLNLLDTAKMYDIVREISEQSTFTVFHSGAGKLRAIPLNDKDPSIAAVIPRDRIVDDDIEVSKTGTIINKMTVKSRWHGERGTFIDSGTYEDTVSQSDVQSERTARYEWKNVAGDSAAHVAQHLVNDFDGLWSKQHVKVRFSTPGFTYSYLQPGDWIRLDADVDGITKPYGGSWERKNLLVVETGKGMKTTEITAVELAYDTVLASPATLASSAPALTVTPGAVSVPMSPATLASSVPTLAVSAPPP